jgi:hypothetical protein
MMSARRTALCAEPTWKGGVFPHLAISKSLNSKWEAYAFSFLLAREPSLLSERRGGLDRQLVVAYIELAATRAWKPNLTSTFSYTHEQVFPGTDAVRFEHRFWAQIAANHPGPRAGVTYGHRLRLDARYLSTPDPDVWLARPRLRYQLARNHTLNPTWSVRADAELFAELHASRTQRIEEIWASALLRKQVHPQLRLDAGLQYIGWAGTAWLHQPLLAAGIGMSL